LSEARAPDLRVPLVARVPNLANEPRAVDTLRAHLRDHAAAWLVGPGAERVAFGFAHAHGRSRLDRTLVVHPGAEPPALALTRLLARCSAMIAPDWMAIADDPTLATEMAIDAADLLDAWVIVRAEQASDLDALANAALAFGRQARWMFVSQDAPAAFAGPVLQVAHAATPATAAPPDDPESPLTPLDALLSAHRDAEALAWLATDGAHLLRTGYAAPLAVRVAHRRGDAWRRWALRAALAAGDAEILAKLEPLDPIDAESHEIEARRAIALGRTTEAIGHAEAAAALGDPEALVLGARLAAIFHDPPRMREFVDRWSALGDTASIAQRAALAVLVALDGDPARANRIASDVERELTRRGETPDARTLESLLEASIFSDDMTAGLRMFQRWGADQLASPSLHYGVAFLNLHTGNWAEFDRAVARLERFAHRRSTWSRALGYLRARRAIAEGAAEGMSERIARLWSESVAAGDVLHAALARGLDARWAKLQGVSIQIVRWDATLPQPSGRHQRHISFRDDTSVPVVHDRGTALQRMIEAEFAAGHGDRVRAIAAIEEAADWLERQSLWLDRADVAATEAAIGWSFDARDRLAAARAVLARAATWPSPRFADEVAWYDTLTATEPDFGAFERGLTSPFGLWSQRMRHWWAGRPADNAPMKFPFEQRLLSALRDRFGPTPTVRAGVPERPGWGFDAVSARVWRWDGPPVPLGGVPIVKQLIHALFTSPEGLTKAALANQVWGVKDYHPLRDDKRMQVAVRKLRTLIEADPAHPRRVVTRDDGYALGDAEPARWRSNSTSA
jgi:hypothetical protein